MDATIKINRRHRFAIVPAECLEDQKLSWRAKGIFAYLISRPDGWTIRVKDLINRSTEGRDAVKKSLKELRAAGYAELTHQRNEKGHITGTTYQLHETPISVTPTESLKNRRTEKPSDGKSVGIKKTSLINTNINNKQKEKEESSGSLFSDQTPALVLKKYFKEDSLALRLPGQPSQKTLSRWIGTYGEDYLIGQFEKFEAYLQRPENKKNSAKKIKDCGRTLNNWIKKEWISDLSERQTLSVFRQWWSECLSGLPFQFDAFQTSPDRRQLQTFCDEMRFHSKAPDQELRNLLSALPDFWKGKRLSSILKNFASIKTAIGKTAQGAGAGKAAKHSATVENLDWL